MLMAHQFFRDKIFLNFYLIYALYFLKFTVLPLREPREYPYKDELIL